MDCYALRHDQRGRLKSLVPGPAGGLLKRRNKRPDRRPHSSYVKKVRSCLRNEPQPQK